MRMTIIKSFKRIALIASTLILGFLMLCGLQQMPAAHATTAAYDISGWQGAITDQQAAQLKNEVQFMILKAENGGLYEDNDFANNSQALTNAGVPYGVYDYSLYANPEQASAEAQALYQRAPQASFYVNDAEENDAGVQFNAATQAWAQEMHQLTSKPVVLYSGLYFMNNNMTAATRNAYDALWVAAYGSEPATTYHYDLWQYTDHAYSPALGQYIDASVFPDGNNKPLSFWTDGQNTNPTPTVTPVQPVQKPKRHRARHKKAHQKVYPVVPAKKPSVQPVRKHCKHRKKARPVVPANKPQVKPVRKHRRHRKETRPVTPAQKPTVKPVRKHARKRTGHYKLNPHYIDAPGYHYLQVIRRGGVRLYTTHYKPIARVPRGVILYVQSFKHLNYGRHNYMTRAVGIHWGREDYFTTNKDYVRLV